MFKEEKSIGRNTDDKRTKIGCSFSVVVAKQKKKPSEIQGNCLNLVGFGVNLYGDDSIQFSLRLQYVMLYSEKFLL